MKISLGATTIELPEGYAPYSFMAMGPLDVAVPIASVPTTAKTQQVEHRRVLALNVQASDGATPTLDGLKYALDDMKRKSQGKIAKVFRGSAWIDEATHEVMRVEATSIDSLSYGLGFVARLGEGTKATLSRERIDSSVWLPTSIRLTGDGRALLFRKLNIDYVIEWFNYKRVLE